MAERTLPPLWALASACQVHPRPAQIWMIGPAAGTPGNLGSPPHPCIKRYGRHAVAKVIRLCNAELVIWPPVNVQFVACFAPLSSELDFEVSMGCLERSVAARQLAYQLGA